MYIIRVARQWPQYILPPSRFDFLSCEHSTILCIERFYFIRIITYICSMPNYKDADHHHHYHQHHHYAKRVKTFNFNSNERSSGLSIKENWNLGLGLSRFHLEYICCAVYIFMSGSGYPFFTIKVEKYIVWCAVRMPNIVFVFSIQKECTQWLEGMI